MIVTDQNIGDPVGFLNANRDLIPDTRLTVSRSGLPHLDPQETIVCSADLDLHLTASVFEDSGDYSQETQVYKAGLFDDLYTATVVTDALIGNKRVNALAFPSVGALNQLFEKLGLRPGEDVMKYVHYQGPVTGTGHTPAAAVAEAASRGEALRSVMNYRMFMHDGEFDDHVLGTAIAPTSSTQDIKFAATRANMRKSQVEVARSIDHSTIAAGGLVLRYEAAGRESTDIVEVFEEQIQRGGVDFTWPYVSGPVNLQNQRGSRTVPRTFNGKEKPITGRHLAGLRWWVREVFAPHIDELLPKIEKLKQETALAA